MLPHPQRMPHRVSAQISRCTPLSSRGGDPRHMDTSSHSALDVLSALAGSGGLILASDAARFGLQRELRREFEQRNLLRLRRGVYTATEEWAALTPDQRYLRRIHAHASSTPGPAVYSHFSAAALWGLPIIGSWPKEIHLAIPAAAGGRSRHGIVRHPHDSGCDVVDHDGLRVTSVAATAIALARVLPFAHAVAAMDKAIHEPRRGRPLTTPQQLESVFADLGRVPGRSAARRVLDFASPLSGSPGESISRAGIFLLGFALPEQQTPFWDSDGLIGFTDFFWRTIGKVGEFDGNGKYLRDEFTGGRTAAEIVIAEKAREDRLRAVNLAVCRWDWQLATSLPKFGAFLTRHGIPRARSERPPR